jgi:hypothetical protein
MVLVSAIILPAYQAGAQGVHVTPIGTARTAMPGTAVSWMFNILNPRGAEGEVTLSLPAGWRAVTAPAQLPPGSPSVRYMAGWIVPANARAGRYDVELAVTSQGKTVRAGVTLAINEIRSFELQQVSAPSTVAAGDPIVANFALTNTGNTPARPRVRIRSVAVSFVDSLEATLDPGESREIGIRIPTSRSLAEVKTVVTSVQARLADSAAVARAASFKVVVVPRASTAPAPLSYVRSSMRLIASTGAHGASGAELLGSGALREGSAVRVDYFARKLNAAQTLYGERNEYRAGIESRHFAARVGDIVNRLSPLTEIGRLARGLSAEVRSNGWTLGGFATHSKETRQPRRQRAAYLNRDFGRGVNFNVGFLDNDDARGGKMLSARTTTAFPAARIDAEVAHAIAGKAAEAWRVAASGSTPLITYTASRQKTDRDFPTDARGSSSTVAFAEARPTPYLKLRGAVADYRRSSTAATGDTTLTTSSRRTLAAVVADRLTVEYGTDQRQDTRYAGAQWRGESLLSLKAVARRGSSSIAASSGLGTLSKPGGESRPISRHSLSVAGAVSKRSFVVARMDLFRGGTLFFPNEKSEVRATINAANENALGRFTISAFGTKRSSGGRTSDATVDLSWDRSLPDGKSLSIRGRRTTVSRFDPAGGTSLRAEMTVPFGLPVAPSSIRGRVIGRVYDAQTGKPIKGAVVRLGGRVSVSDASGRVAFSVEGDSAQNLTLTNAMGDEWVPARVMPHAVSPRVGRTLTLDLPLARGSTLTGRVRLFLSGGFHRGEPLPPVEDTAGLSRARIRLTNGEDTRLIVANRGGRFELAGLPPGEWTLSISERDLPDHSYIEGDSVRILLEPGARSAVEIRVMPRRRKITIVHADGESGSRSLD